MSSAPWACEVRKRPPYRKKGAKKKGPKKRGQRIASLPPTLSFTQEKTTVFEIIYFYGMIPYRMLLTARGTRINRRSARIAVRDATTRGGQFRSQVLEKSSKRSAGAARYRDGIARITSNGLARCSGNRFARIATRCTSACCHSGFHVRKQSGERTERATTRGTCIVATIVYNRFAGIAGDRFARGASHGFARVAAIPHYGKAAKNAGFGTRCCRKYDNRGQHRKYNFVFHFDSPKKGWKSLLATTASPSLMVCIGKKPNKMYTIPKKSG